MGDRMRKVCCSDCNYCSAERIYINDDDWEDVYYCTAGSVLIGIVDPDETHNCSNYWPCA